MGKEHNHPFETITLWNVNYQAKKMLDQMGNDNTPCVIVTY